MATNTAAQAARSPDEPMLVPLARASEREYCEYARKTRHNELWWYFNGLAPYRGYSRPFADPRGRYWFCVKPGFAWPVDYFRTVDYRAWSPNFSTWMLGCQFPVSDAAADSKVWMNVMFDLTAYDITRVVSDKRRAVRKGLKNLDLVPLDPSDRAVSDEAVEVWNSHVTRTGWNTVFEADNFAASWAELRDWPGTTIIGAREKTDGKLCSWTIIRCVDDVAYVDTLASHTDRLANRPNDAVVFSALFFAARCGLTKAHYSLKSSIASLEAFKESLGFIPHPFPAKLNLRFPVGLALKTLKPGMYRRLLGDPNWDQEAHKPGADSTADQQPAKTE